MKRYWLMKSEPDVFSIDDFEKAVTTGWEGVRNYEARNLMRDVMKPKDRVLFYHSNAEPSGVAGLAEVFGPPVPDPSQFDKKSEYFDPKSAPHNPRWQMVHLKFVERFAQVLPLATLRSQPRLAGMALLRPGQRLSVQRVLPEHFRFIVQLARSG